ncbi:MAG: hypothetical protein FJ041_06520 [Candidatus Cloacimonetes bacterium]|nr:hypothetical protein [Candidatus Cloacimonadota bacterium]
MAKKMKVIMSFSEANDNAVRFQDYLKQEVTLQHKLSQYRHWYYFPSKSIFAPSVFIGYKNNTYHSEHAHLGDGRETERALAQFFKKVVSSVEQQDIFINDLYGKLEAFLDKYSKKPKRNAIIHLPREAVKK